MKKVALIFLFLFTGLVNAQTLLKSDITIADLQNVFVKDGFKVLDKGDDYLELQFSTNESFFLDRSKIFFIFSTNPLLKKNVEKTKIDALISKINESPAIKAIHVPEKTKLIIEYYFPISSGYTKETLLDAVTVFQTLAFGINNLDEQKILE